MSFFFNRHGGLFSYSPRILCHHLSYQVIKLDSLPIPSETIQLPWISQLNHQSGWCFFLTHPRFSIIYPCYIHMFISKCSSWGRNVAPMTSPSSDAAQALGAPRGLHLQTDRCTFPFQWGVLPNRAFHKWRYPKWMVYLLENPIKIDDFGVPQFQETSKSSMFIGFSSKQAIQPLGYTHLWNTPALTEWDLHHQQTLAHQLTGLLWWCSATGTIPTWSHGQSSSSLTQ